MFLVGSTYFLVDFKPFVVLSVVQGIYAKLPMELLPALLQGLKVQNITGNRIAFIVVINNYL